MLRTQLLEPVVHSLDAALRLLQHRPSGRPPDGDHTISGAAALTEGRLQAAAAEGGAAAAEAAKPEEAPSVMPFLALPPLLLGRRTVYITCEPQPTSSASSMQLCLRPTAITTNLILILL